MTTKVQKVIALDPEELLGFCGEHDRKLRKIQDKLKATVVARGNELRLAGSEEEVAAAHRMISDLIEAQRAARRELTDLQLDQALEHGEEEERGSIGEWLGDTIDVPMSNKRLAALNPAQKRYIDAIRTHDIVFCIGPAGTGKTYLAVAMAVENLLRGRFKRIVLVRPVVEAGESLGFLPGDIAQKVDPYVRPLYDALHDMMDVEKIRELTDDGVIEIAPLAYMRGRSLNGSIIILDEAQNTTYEQMKMFLTRMGYDSKLVITGDVTQIDLPPSKRSGLVQAQKLLSDIPEIKFVKFTRKDVVRHALVQKIVLAYEQWEKK